MKKVASYLAELVVVIALFKALKMIQHRLIDDLIMSYRQVEEDTHVTAPLRLSSIPMVLLHRLI